MNSVRCIGLVRDLFTVVESAGAGVGVDEERNDHDSG